MSKRTKMAFTKAQLYMMRDALGDFQTDLRRNGAPPAVQSRAHELHERFISLVGPDMSKLNGKGAPTGGVTGGVERLAQVHRSTPDRAPETFNDSLALALALQGVSDE